ncbi:MAG: hypothetical protein ACRDMI_03990 [Streptosporangiaceae bacterium]
MPTFEWTERFGLDRDKLESTQRDAFNASFRQFVEDLQRGAFRKRLRVKPVQGKQDVWEMTWAGDGRATFSYGDEQRPGHKHVIWRRVGTHSVFRAP